MMEIPTGERDGAEGQSFNGADTKEDNLVTSK